MIVIIISGTLVHSKICDKLNDLCLFGCEVFPYLMIQVTTLRRWMTYTVMHIYAANVLMPPTCGSIFFLREVDVLVI